MKFNFQFESLLNIRRHEEKKEQQVLGHLMEKQYKLKKELSSYRAKIDSFEQFTSNSEQHTAADLRQRYELKQDLQRASWRLQQQQNRLQEKVDQQRSELIEANKKTQMLEKLKDREHIKFMEYHQHIEQKQQNAVATQIYNRAK